MEASHKNHHNWGFPWKRLNFRWWKYVLPHFFFPFFFDWILKSLVDFFHLKIWSSVSNGWVSPNFRDTKLGPKTENIWLPSEWSPSRFHSKISWKILKETYTLENGKPKVKSYHSQWKKHFWAVENGEVFKWQWAVENKNIQPKSPCDFRGSDAESLRFSQLRLWPLDVHRDSDRSSGPREVRRKVHAPWHGDTLCLPAEFHPGKKNPKCFSSSWYFVGIPIPKKKFQVP